MNEDVLRISSCSDRRTPSSGMRHLWPAQHLEKHSPLCGSGYPWNSVCMCVCACVCTRSCRCCRTAPRVPRPQIKTHICKTKKKKKKALVNVTFLSLSCPFMHTLTGREQHVWYIVSVHFILCVSHRVITQCHVAGGWLMSFWSKGFERRCPGSKCWGTVADMKSSYSSFFWHSGVGFDEPSVNKRTLQ